MLFKLTLKILFNNCNYEIKMIATIVSKTKDLLIDQVRNFSKTKEESR